MDILDKETCEYIHVSIMLCITKSDGSLLCSINQSIVVNMVLSVSEEL